MPLKAGRVLRPFASKQMNEPLNAPVLRVSLSAKVASVWLMSAEVIWRSRSLGTASAPPVQSSSAFAELVFTSEGITLAFTGTLYFAPRRSVLMISGQPKGYHCPAM
jgi:hypothetical protein